MLHAQEGLPEITSPAGTLWGEKFKAIRVKIVGHRGRTVKTRIVYAKHESIFNHTAANRLTMCAKRHI